MRSQSDTTVYQEFGVLFRPCRRVSIGVSQSNRPQPAPPDPSTPATPAVMASPLIRVHYVRLSAPGWLLVALENWVVNKLTDRTKTEFANEPSTSSRLAVPANRFRRRSTPTTAQRALRASGGEHPLAPISQLGGLLRWRGGLLPTSIPPLSLPTPNPRAIFHSCASGLSPPPSSSPRPPTPTSTPSAVSTL